MKPNFLSVKDVNLRKAKLQNQLLDELCDMVDMARNGKVPFDMVIEHWNTLKSIYDLNDFFVAFVKELYELQERYPMAITPDCNEY